MHVQLSQRHDSSEALPQQASEACQQHQEGITQGLLCLLT